MSEPPCTTDRNPLAQRGGTIGTIGGKPVVYEDRHSDPLSAWREAKAAVGAIQRVEAGPTKVVMLPRRDAPRAAGPAPVRTRGSRRVTTPSSSSDDPPGEPEPPRHIGRSPSARRLLSALTEHPGEVDRLEDLFAWWRLMAWTEPALERAIDELVATGELRDDATGRLLVGAAA